VEASAAWLALSTLIGTWEGDGMIEYPTLDPLAYHEVLEIGEGAAPGTDSTGFLHYLQQTSVQRDGKVVASHNETGFIELSEDATLRVMNAQGTDRIESLHGDISDVGGRVSIELASVAIAGDDRMIRSWRSLEVDGDDLAYTMGMATTQVPDGAIHLVAKLSRR
jgi:hypothetical protein